MATFKEINNIILNSSFTEQELSALMYALQVKIQAQANIAAPNRKSTKLSKELSALLEKCTENRCDGKTRYCPYCKSIHTVKNGHKNGRQRYLCRDCRKTFGDTFGTALYCSKLSAGQWKAFLTLTMHNASLKTFVRDMGIHISTAWYNRHKLCSLIKQRNIRQNSFPSITEGDEFYTPLSFIGARNKSFFIEELGRMPRHHRNMAEKYEYVKSAGYDIPDVEDIEGYLDENTPNESALKVAKVLNAIGSEEKRKRGISNEQVCVLTCIDRATNLFISPACVGRITDKHIEQKLHDKFSRDAILVTDSHTAYRSFAEHAEIHLEQVPSGKHTVGTFNLARVNSLHSRMEYYQSRYKEVASKYIDHYLSLFRWQDKHRSENTQSKVGLLYEMLTETMPWQVRFDRIKYRPMPFDMKRMPMPA